METTWHIANPQRMLVPVPWAFAFPKSYITTEKQPVFATPGARALS